MNVQLAAWYNMVPGSELEDLVRVAMQGASRNLSAMVGRTIDIDTHRVRTVPLNQLVEYAGDPEMEMVGVYLLINGDLHGQAMVLQSIPSALRLVDLLMGMPVGTTDSLGEMEQAALGEVGNMLVAGFLNSMASATGGQLLPSPPSVMVNMLGAIVNVVASSATGGGDDLLLIIDTALKDAERAVEAHLWVLPGRATRA